MEYRVDGESATPPPWLTAEIDQVLAWRGQVRADRGAARREDRCVAAPAGCGQPLRTPNEFRDQASYAEYGITGLCQRCQDKLFAPSDDEVEQMSGDLANYGRCGEWRPYDFVDVGVGVMKGFDCCNDERGLNANPPRPSLGCTVTAGCLLAAGHALGCELREGAVY